MLNIQVNHLNKKNNVKRTFRFTPTYIEKEQLRDALSKHCEVGLRPKLFKIDGENSYDTIMKPKHVVAGCHTSSTSLPTNTKIMLLSCSCRIEE